MKQFNLYRGVHPPLRQLYISPMFQIPLFPKNVQTPWKFFPNFTFSHKILRISSANISDDLFWISPYFRCFSGFPPISAKLLFPPIFANSPSFCKMYVFLHTLCVFRFPSLVSPWCIYASYNARTVRPWICKESLTLLQVGVTVTWSNNSSCGVNWRFSSTFGLTFSSSCTWSTLRRTF